MLKYSNESDIHIYIYIFMIAGFAGYFPSTVAPEQPLF